MKLIDIKKAIARGKEILGRKRVLRPKEKKVLAKVKTTAEEAEMILERNTELLRSLWRGEDYFGNMGCPHCRPSLGCCACRWDAICDDLEYQDSWVCLQMPFGGVAYFNAPSVRYSHDKESLVLDNEVKDHATATFLRGHIEWALIVLGKELRKRRKK